VHHHRGSHIMLPRRRGMSQGRAGRRLASNARASARARATGFGAEDLFRGRLPASGKPGAGWACVITTLLSTSVKS
jgi:hypothetical protein